LATSTGTVFSFGTAKSYGTVGNLTLNKPSADREHVRRQGLLALVASDGGIFAFGDAINDGSMGGLPLKLRRIRIADL